MTFQTLTQALNAHASNDYSINYLQSQNDEADVSFSDLKQRAQGILFNLQQHGLKVGDECIILTDNNEFFLDAFWACLYGGIVPVPVAVANNDEHRYKLLRIFKKLARPQLYTNEKTLHRLITFCELNNLHDEANKLAQHSFLIESIEDISQPGNVHTAQPEDTAFIQFSSGSTSEPKGVVLTHKNILTNINAIIKSAAFTSADRMFSWMPLTHDMGMIGFHLTAIVARMNHTIMDTSLFVRRPLLWLTAASKKQATILCSPNFGYKHFLKVFEAKGIDPIDLSCVRLIFNGAEPISIDICQQFLQAMKPSGLDETAMFPVYGLAEASLAVSFPALKTTLQTVTIKRSQPGIGDAIEPVRPSDKSITLVLVGRPIQDCDVRIVDNNNTVLAESHVGHIQLKGDNVTRGYYHDDDINRALISESGWLDTGDSGAFINGQLVITGRIKDIIFINGQNFYSHDLENILHQLDGLELGKVVVDGARASGSNEDELIVYILHRGDIESFLPTAQKVRKTINQTTGVEVHHVIAIKHVPKTTSGKIQRHLLTEEYIKGSYDDIIAEMQLLTVAAPSSENNAAAPDSIAAHISEICRKTVTDKSIGLDDNLFETGISSLALAEIHEQIDNDYPGKVEINDLFDYPTIRQLAIFLENQINP